MHRLKLELSTGPTYRLPKNKKYFKKVQVFVVFEKYSNNEPNFIINNRY